MKFTLDSGAGRCQVLASDGAEIRVLYAPPVTGNHAERQRVETLKFSTSVIITAWQPVPWRPQRCEQLTKSDFSGLLEYAPEIVVYGSGDKLRFPPAELLSDLANAGIGFEVMNTPAACRTYNLLMMEGRQVVAALLLGNAG